jgi:uncharacterized protein (DUF342 family)/CheY-like chemotaxis protein
MILTSYMMPKMKGDEILKKARELTPDAQRMLLADTSDLDTLVKSINTAGIHACVTLPFEDDVLLNQVELCCDHYEQNEKQKNLKRLTQRQNKQLFQIASNFKKKSDGYAKQIEIKKKEVRLLESRIRSAGGSIGPEKELSVEQLLHKRGTPFSPDDFAQEFTRIKEQAKQIMETAVSQHYINIDTVSYDRVLTQTLVENRQAPVVKEIMPLLMNLLEKGGLPQPGSGHQIKEIILEEQFTLTLKNENTKAFIKLKTFDGHSLSLAHVKQFLEKNKVINGVVDDHEIEQWLYRSTPDDEPFLIAQGRPAKYPKDARIRYHFPTEFLHAGKINEDGSINFQDRGEIPFVEDGAFLAAKIFAEDGMAGIDVLGREIAVEDPSDLTFSAGPGTRMSEDGVRIYAITSGQPHLDAMGNISVCPEYQVKGDIDFETGDVDFDGNVVVNGTVKEGFKVKCASLTATEIQGALIDIEGDLNVSLGIVDTELVKVKGSVQAKFVHNSKINSFGDLIVTKEIIDSEIYLSGACINTGGLILNSKISAKRGIDAGNIGNTSSKASHLTVGVDEHTNILVAKVDSKLNMNNAAIADLKQEIRELQKEDQSLHAVISQHAHVQDRAQLELKDIEKKMENLKASGNMAAYQKVSNTVKEIRKNAQIAEEKINDGFDRQDEIALEISQKNGRINEFEEINKALLDEKKRLLEFTHREEPVPEVKVARKIESGTKIFSANASLTLNNSNVRCRIREYSRSPDGMGGMEFYEMKIGNY